ncbi:MAG: DUF3990 domain-containing protein [Fibromonadaceae bacterium]|nr:DUF3990 domain-containing protein [Fibromonadaceae bacterium]
MKTLYHGSSEIIDNPQFGKGNAHFNELYLENVSRVCGDMLNYAVNVCNEDGDEFL